MHSSTVLPLHDGKAPKWLFSRMVKLGGKISDVIIEEFGADELVMRLADSNWFQALACALGYDWHSSGTTTVTMGALKIALKDSKEIVIAGGKGMAGIHTPEDIAHGAEKLSRLDSAAKLIEYSKLSAKVDSSMVYDNMSIYHHSFIFSKNLKWAVVQQGIRDKSSMAVRFQWLSENIDKKDFANEPHSNITADMGKSEETIDLTYSVNKWVRDSLIDSLDEIGPKIKQQTLYLYPSRHSIIPELDISPKGIEILKKAYEMSPSNYTELLLTKGIGRKTIRSLAMISSLIFEKEVAKRDPILFAYNLGGKDGIPFKIDKKHYDSILKSFSEIIDMANISKEDKFLALKRLSNGITQ
ncbi:MAG: DUF763 domain-containing protein [Candidatus Micrarchaeia archaeon]